MALNQALSGINAAQSDLNVIANNIANAGTTGFKGSRAEFADVFAVTGLNLNSSAVGSGARLTDVAQEFSQGDLQETGQSLDLAISGNGFFTVNDGTGPTYTRDGAFTKDANGYVVNADGSKLQVYPPNAAGGFDTSTLTSLQLNSSQSNATATSAITIAANLPAGATVIDPTTTPLDPTNSATYTDATPVTVYDSQGGSHAADVYYTKTGTNTWNANLYIDGQSAGTQQLTFNASGDLTSPTSGSLSFTPPTLSSGATFATAMTVNLSGTTQFGTDYSAGAVSQNGYQAGTLSSVDIDSNGIVTATYSNDQTAQLGQVAVANFADLQGLRQRGNTTWAASSQSGSAVMGAAGTGQFGDINSGELESSTTSDTTSQLVDMIQAQRDYQANAQVLSTDSSLATTLFNAVSR